MDQANILIIGGGVIGCAIAEAVSRRWQDVFLVEQFPKLGMATSTRNSGVNHSGIYYPKNSLKARLCVEGNRLTYEFCAKHKVPFRHCGKIVVAADAHEEGELIALKKRGEDNGVEGLRLISADEIRKREPHVKGVSALDVPSTGIVSAGNWFTHTRGWRQIRGRISSRTRRSPRWSLRVKPFAWGCESAMKSTRKTKRSKRGA
jgi:L-2-hydroxyglutarate oxidase LhgO